VDYKDMGGFGFVTDLLATQFIITIHSLALSLVLTACIPAFHPMCTELSCTDFQQRTFPPLDS
jgi:hypothetical protein